MTACGAQKTQLAIGQELVREGDCAGAEEYLDVTIAQPQTALELGLAYFLKGKCAEKSGDYASAYENYYAAKLLACYVVSHDTKVNLNTYARSEYCERIIPEMLEKLAPKVGDAAAVERIEAKVNGIMTDMYMKRFEKRLE